MKEIRETSNKGIQFLIKEEGLVKRPYLDQVGVPTIGVGSTYWEDGTKVKMTDAPITTERAIQLFRNTLKGYELAVYSSTRDDINHNQFDALTSFTYNVGTNGFKTSELVKKVNQDKEDPKIRQAFEAWKNAGGKPILLARRKREAALYFTPDNAQQTIDQLHVKSFNELTQGAGPARQKGQENALGKYILTADADCFYPEVWIDEMMRVLTQKDVVCVYGRYSFIGEPGFPRWKLRILEKLKDAMAEIRHIKQPYFNTFGISMGYVKEFGLKIGFIKINRRGEDGQLCMDLMRYGKIKQVKSRKARVWTGVRTLSQNGSFYNIVISRIKEDLKRFKYNFITRN